MALFFFTAKSPRKISFQTGKIEVVIFFCAAARESFGEGFVQSCKGAKFLELNTVPRVCPWRSWRLGGLKFFSFEQISLSESPWDRDAGGFYQGKFGVKSGGCVIIFFHRQVAKEDKFSDWKKSKLSSSFAPLREKTLEKDSSSAAMAQSF